MKNISTYLLFIALTAMVLSCKSSEETSAKAKKETLLKEQEIVESSLAEQLKYSGIDFYARGNEPFWALDLDYQNKFIFNGLGLDSMVFNPVQPEKAMDANAMRFYTEIDGGHILININESECTDNMSGEAYNFNVNIEIERNGSEESYHGCGNFIPDYRLHDIWVLTEIYDDSLELMRKLSRPIGQLEFKVDERLTMGKFICNSFTGGFWLQGNEVRFKTLASTQMLCKPNPEINEHAIYTAMGKVNRFDIKNGYLYFYNRTKLLMVYKKVD